MLFTGSCTAICTPFTDSGINLPEFERLIEFQIQNGTDALLVLGTTGEPATMTADEKQLVMDCAIKTVGGRVPVIIGIGGNSTQGCIDMAKAAAKAGANGVLCVTPYYNKCTPEGMVSHFTAAADATDLPMILYNVPSRTAMNITPEIAQRLAEHKNIAAIKEASGNISQIAETARLTRGKLTIYSGNDDHIVPVLSLGGKGVISVLANVAPRYTHELVAAYLAGETQKATEMQLDVNALVSALFCEVNPIPVKTALRALGYDMGPLRLPLCDMTAEHHERLMAELAAFGLLK